MKLISRRGFVVSAVAGSSGVAWGLLSSRTLEAGQTPPENPFDAWVHIGKNGSTEIVLNKSEMGQGVFTSLPMLIAEEAEIDWDGTFIKQGTNGALTGGSGSVRHSYIPYRQIGATVRTAMVMAAAEEWDVPAEECTARKSLVTHRISGRSLAYSQLIDRVRSRPLPDSKTVRLKNPSDFTLIGRSQPHLDIPAKVQGKACFGLDVRLPGMVFAVVAQCPTLDGTLIRVDTTKAKLAPDVLDVFQIPFAKTGGEIAVVAKTTWAAIQGRKALEIEWRPGERQSESTASLSAQFHKALDAPEQWQWSNTTVDPDQIALAVKVETVYEFPFLAHCTLEPMNTTVQIKDGKCEVWAPTQGGDIAQRNVAKALDIPVSDVTVNVTFVGGGFGRRFGGDFERQAALVAQRMKRPVQLVWTREDDFAKDSFRPAGARRMRGGLDAAGNLIAWSDKLADTYIIQDRKYLFETPGAVEIPYPARHQKCAYVAVESGVPRGAWRSVGPSFNGFAVECFIDELAHAAKEDPYLFRRRLLATSPSPQGKDATDPRPGADSPLPDPRALITLLDLVAEKVEWKTPIGPKRGRGLAIWQLHGTYLAQVSEVTVEGSNIRVDRIVTALDCGQAINPNGIKAQIEGGTIQSLSAALYEEITVKNGRIQQQNFDTYQLIRIPAAPVLETYIVPSNREPGGIGEAAMPLPPASVANAVFAATGKRLRKMPFRLQEVTA